MKHYPFFFQKLNFDCAYACIKMLCVYYEKKYDYILSEQRNMGFNINHIIFELENQGFNCYAVKVQFDKLILLQSFPCIAYYPKGHFVVIYNIDIGIVIADPLLGLYEMDKTLFFSEWLNGEKGIIILATPIAL